MNVRNERSLRRAAIFYKWWRKKVKKATRQFQVFQNEIRSRGSDKRKKEELRKVRRQKRLANIRL
jgi:hypothetical protein